MAPHDARSLVLGLDAAAARAEAVLLDAAGGIVALWRQDEARPGTADLAPAVAGLLAAQGLRAADLAGVAVGMGPGSYTGLRSSIAFARALCWGAGCPLVGLPSVAGQAAAALAADAALTEVVTLVDARREQHVRTDFGRGNAGARLVAGPCLVERPEVDALREARVAGRLLLDPPQPDVAWLARLALPELAAGGHDPATVRPIYLKPSHAELAFDARQRANR